MEAPVQLKTDEKSEREKHSGTAESKEWEKVQEKTNDALLLEKLDEEV